ncbi:MAG: hypothetical protein IJN98_04680 [Alistipes sp.]|nr:hypothetical protein [Alistipes sp.]
MKSLKIFFLSALVATAGLFTACSEDYDWSAGELAEGPQAYFSADVQTSYTVSAEDTSVTLPVLRIETDGALDVPVLATFAEGEEGLFNVPASVAFADGEKSALIDVTFAFADLTPGKSYSFSLTLDDPTLTTPYGNSQVGLTIAVPEPYVLLGKGLIRDDIITSLFSVDNVEWEVEIYENTNQPGYIFLKNAYTSLYPYNEPGDYVTEDKYFVVNIADPNRVIIPKQGLGMDWNPTEYGEFIVGTTAPGTLKDNIITFPVKGLLVGMMIYSEGDFGWYANTNGLFRIALPGAVLTDFTMEAAYAGFRAWVDGSTFPIVAVASEEDTDVASLAFSFVEGDITADFAAEAEAIAADPKNKAEFTMEEDGLRFAECMSPESLEGGKVYTCVVVPYDADGEAAVDSAIAVAFYFPGVGASEAPECQVAAKMGYVSEYVPDYSANYPDDTYLFWMIEGQELKEVYLAGFFAQGTIDGMIAQYVDTGAMTLEEFYDLFVESNGELLDQDFMDELDQYGYTWNIVGKLPADTAVEALVKAVNIYGSVGFARMEGKTKPAATEATLNGKGALVFDQTVSNQFTLKSVKWVK